MISPCYYCGSTVTCVTHRDQDGSFSIGSAGCFAYVYCYDCRARGPEIGPAENVADVNRIDGQAIHVWNHTVIDHPGAKLVKDIIVVK